MPYMHNQTKADVRKLIRESYPIYIELGVPYGSQFMEITDEQANDWVSDVCHNGTKHLIFHKTTHGSLYIQNNI
jgi:hypothetical protein